MTLNNGRGQESTEGPWTERWFDAEIAGHIDIEVEMKNKWGVGFSWGEEGVSTERGAQIPYTNIVW